MEGFIKVVDESDYCFLPMFKLIIAAVCCVLLSYSCEKDGNDLRTYKNPVEGYPYFASHLFIDKIYANSNAIIPCQSLIDIEIASRLGFPSIELNVHETSDGKFVTIHGVKGAFGEQVVKKDGTSVSDIAISDVDYSFIKDNIIYRSSVPEYRTTIPTIEDALRLCELNGIRPYICGQFNKRLFDIVAKYKVEPIWGCYSINDAIKVRKKTDGLITYWSNMTDENEIVSLCKEIGPPYIHYIATDVLNDNSRLKISEASLEKIITRVHSLGCYVGFAGCYTPASLTNKLWKLGFDYASSGWAVNEFSKGDVFHIDSVFSANIITNGQVSDNLILLNNNDYIFVDTTESPNISKGYLSFHLKGRIHLNMGDYVNLDIESEGDSFTFSSFFINQKPVFTITADGDSEISSLSFFASVC